MRRGKTLVLAGGYALLLFGGWYAGGFLMEVANVEIRPLNEPEVHMMIMATTAIYALASAIPFVPGAEIGLGMILIFGGKIALLVWLSMVAALTSSYLVGLLVPARLTASFFGYFGLERARDLVTQMNGLSAKQRMDLLIGNAPRKLIPFLIRHRYLALIVLINVPGNSLIGGGGGIAFSAGLSRLFSLPLYVLTVAVATVPIPAFFYFTS
ncbi:MAG: hypothetical protein AB3N20_15025 [Rhizobiaceae bacterium]